MKRTDYQTAKIQLKQEAQTAKKVYPADKPAIRQIINDYADYLCKSLQLSEYQRNLLANYACTLHPNR